jgi:hypothetical protein
VPIGFVDLVNRADIGMVETGGCLGLVQETLFVFVVREEMGGQELEGDGALELAVLGFIYDPHTTLAELGEDLVVGYGLADHALMIAGKPIAVKTGAVLEVGRRAARLASRGTPRGYDDPD